MYIKAFKAHKITAGDDLSAILDKYLPKLEEKSVVVVSAKIVALCEGNVIKRDGSVDKEKLVKQESERYITDELYYKQTMLTIKNHILIPYAGIDESNADGYLVLWPKDAMKSAAKIWNFLRKKHTLERLGVILSDSNFIPLRRGAVGLGISWCGFAPIQNLIGSSDVFGRTLKYTTSSHIDGLAAAAEMVMGEGNQQTPLAVINDVPFVTFQNRVPTPEEVAEMKPVEKDYFSPLLTAAKWKKGGSKA